MRIDLLKHEYSSIDFSPIDKNVLVKDFMNEEYYCPLRSIKKFLKEFIKKYGFKEVFCERDDLCTQNNSFVIKIPDSLDSNKMMVIWEEIITETENFSEENNLMKQFNDSFILLKR